jgi:hypothetical protein
VRSWPGKGAGGGGGDGDSAAPSVGRRIVVVGNAAHKVLLYDTAAGRRPQMEVAWREARITALAAEDAGKEGGTPGRVGALMEDRLLLAVEHLPCPEPEVRRLPTPPPPRPGPAGKRVWAANGMGHVEALDLRAGRMAGTLKGAGGSVRGLALHPGGEPLIASAGLDRFVRVHSTGSRANLGRAYTKQQLTAVAWLAPLPAAAGAAAADAEGADGEGHGQAPGRRKQKQQAQKRQRKQRRGGGDSDDEEDDDDLEASSSGEESGSGSGSGSDGGSDADTSSDSGSDSEGGGGRRRGGRQPMEVKKHQTSGGKRRKGRGGAGGGGRGRGGGKKRRQ